jgi:hypothetical protein
MGKGTKEVISSKDVAVQDQRTLMGPVTCQPARLIDDALEVTKIEGLPAEFASGNWMSGFPPSVKFEKVGDFVAGEYIHLRTDVGPNHSRVYELAIADGQGGTYTAIVWGATALDRQFDSAYPPVQQGDKLVIVFIGQKETQRKQSPVKLFALKVFRG